MKLSRRELILAFSTGLVVVVGLSYLLGAPALARWKAATEQRTKLGDQRKLAQRLIAQRGEWEARYVEQRGTIPMHTTNEQVSAVILKRVEQLATENGLTLARVQPDKEKTIGELSELAIDCAWEGTLEPLVRFLYAVQKHGAILDVRQLTVSPGQGAPDRLKGNFTLFFAFRRVAPGSGGLSVETADPAPPSPAAGTP
jgi:Tfp pilus assembly protein PilO